MYNVYNARFIEKCANLVCKVLIVKNPPTRQNGSSVSYLVHITACIQIAMEGKVL